MSLIPLWPLAAIAGALIGSFLNVVIWRVPRRESLVTPGSHCPNCGRPIRPYDNIPVLSWLLLRGRCRDCRTRISPRYPLVELGTAAAFALVLPWAATLPTVPATASVVLVVVAYLYLAAVSIALALIDLDVHRLPNAIVLPSYVVVIVLLAAASLLAEDPWSLARAAIGGAALLLVYGALVLAYPGGMGLGDVKLAGVLGFAAAWIGWGALAVAAFAPFLLGGLFGIVMLLARRAGRKTRIPFGPWMLAGAWIGFVAGEPIARVYLGIVGLA